MTNIPGTSREARTADRRLIKWVLALLYGLASSLAVAQELFLVEGIFDAEFYKTDANSTLLSKNGGDIALLGRLQLWSAFQISSGFQIYALGEIETDNLSGDHETEAELEQYALRYSSQSSPYYFLEAGKILSPLSAYSNRHLSTQNPLIEQPYIYITSYPLGIQAAGSSGWLDYRAAMLDQPDINPSYISVEPDSAFRPALGFGVTLFTGLRFGFSYTNGPYLNRQVGAYLPSGTAWRDFEQQILGFDFQFSRGYLELNGQLVVSKYDVPFHDQRTDDTSYYLELKYTWTPRLYGAVRFEKIEAAFISHSDGLTWLAPRRNFRDLEVGLGYRFSSNTLLKVAYRCDNWDADDTPESFIRSGHSLALQLSHYFDLGSRFVKKPW